MCGNGATTSTNLEIMQQQAMKATRCVARRAGAACTVVAVGTSVRMVVLPLDAVATPCTAASVTLASALFATRNKQLL